MATNSSFTALPDDVLQRVLLGVALDDHDATAAACRVFRDVIRGPRFLRLRREYGFAERRIILVAHSDDEGPLEIRLPGKPRIVAASIPELRIDFSGTTTDGGARLFVTTKRRSGGRLVVAVDASARRWSRFATLPLNQCMHCMEWHGGILYVAGGHKSGEGFFNTLKAFDETTGLWEDLPPMPHACAFAASGVVGNELFIAGGVGVGNQALSTLQIYDFTTRTWRLGAPLPYGRCGACGVVVDGKLHLVASRMLTGWGRWLMYDVQSNTWTEEIPRPNRLASDGAMHAFVDNDCIVGVHRHNLTFYHGTWNSGLGLGTPGIAHAVGGSVVLG
jgi:hypothetical protein